MVLQWKDITEFSKGDKERKPSVFKAKIGKFTIVILNSHRDYPGVWVMHLYPGFFEAKPLEALDREQAQNEALDILRSILNEALEVMEYGY